MSDLPEYKMAQGTVFKYQMIGDCDLGHPTGNMRPDIRLPPPQYNSVYMKTAQNSHRNEQRQDNPVIPCDGRRPAVSLAERCPPALVSKPPPLRFAPPRVAPYAPETHQQQHHHQYQHGNRGQKVTCKSTRFEENALGAEGR